LKAIRIQSFGGPDALILSELPKPSLARGQVLIAVEAAGIGLVDVQMRRGTYGGFSEPGFVPGLEVAGAVVAVGEGVDRSWLERRVFAFIEAAGGYAEYATADVHHLTPVPSALSAAQAVALGVNALVAKFSLQRAHVKAGERVLVRGASGGIGYLATQLAAQAGAVVTVATSSQVRGQRLRELGATHVMGRSAQPVETAAEDFDVIIDTVAGPELPAFLGRLRKNGRLVLCGAAGGVPPADSAQELLVSYKKSLTLSMFTLYSVPQEEGVKAMKELFELTLQGRLKPIIHESLPLASAAVAHFKLEAGEVFGKLVLTN
jgi:NADPH:quinone reductase